MVSRLAQKDRSARKNGPCPLIAICNHLILRGKLTLPKEVSNNSLCHAVYDMLFPKLKDDEVVPMTDEIMKLDKGLNMSVLFESTKGFEASNGYKIFQTLEIQLYHAWVLHPQEDEHIIKAIGSKSHDQVTLALGLYDSHEGVDSSDSGIMDEQQYSTAKTLITGHQMTSFGLSSLQNDMADDELAILFHNNHYSTIYKHSGSICSLITDDRLATIHTWQRLAVNGDGAYMSHDWGSRHRGLDMSKFDKGLQPSYKQGSKSAIKYHLGGGEERRAGAAHLGQVLGQHRQGPDSGRSQQKGSIPAKAGPEQHYSKRSVEPKLQSASSSSEKFSISGRSTPSDSGKQYASHFTQDKDKELGKEFGAFLEGFKTKDGIPYYKGAVAAMNVHGIAEIYVQYGHIKDHDPKLAYSISCCFHRIREHLNDAARDFIQSFTEFDIKFVGSPTVYISDLPTPKRWMPLKKFFSLPGNEPAVNYDIYCGDVILPVVRGTLIGRVAFANFLVMMCQTHNRGYSWVGDFTPDDVMIDENLEIDIWAKLIRTSEPSARQNDFARGADVIEYCGVDGRLPGFFNHLRTSLRNFIPADRYSRAMLRKYQRFITTHMALRPSMANLKFIDDVYGMHQALSPRAKRLLQAVLNNQILSWDWRSIFIGPNKPENVPDILKRVYVFNKQDSGEGGSGSDEGGSCEGGSGSDEGGSGEGAIEGGSGEGGSDEGGSVEGAVEVVTPHSDEVTNDAAKCEPCVDATKLEPHSAEVSNDRPKDHEQETLEPFEGNIEGMVVCTRHVRHHGTNWSKVKGKQSLRKLSELEMIISNFLVDYPAVMEQLIYDLDTFGAQDPSALEEIEEMLNEILEDYDRAETRYLQFIDKVEAHFMLYAGVDESDFAKKKE